MRILYTMLRVGNLERSIAFYTDVMGMRLLRRQEYPDGRFTLAFVGYQDQATGATLELTYNWDTTKYEPGTGFGHIAVEVDDVAHACAEIQRHGGRVTRPAGPMKHGPAIIAFAEDPDGYRIALIQKAVQRPT